MTNFDAGSFFCDHFENVVGSARKSVDEMLLRKTSPADLAFLSAIRSCTERAITLQLVRSMNAECATDQRAGESETKLCFGTKQKE